MPKLYEKADGLVNKEQWSSVELRTFEWVKRVVVGLNLCPFANAVVKSDDIAITTESSSDMATVLASFATAADRLLLRAENATLMFVLPNGFDRFDDYLDLVDLAESLLVDMELDDLLQIATFHPHYQFEDSDFDDAANYTNRSPYPTLHLLQEGAVAKAVDAHPNTDDIPQRNIDLLRNMEPQALQELINEEGHNND